MLRRLNPVPYVKNRIRQAYQRKVDNVKAKWDAIPIVPQRFQGTVVEHWAKYWKYLFKDYLTVAFGVLKYAKNNPGRAVVIGGTGYATVRLAEMNPSETDFKQQLRSCCNELGSLPETMQNTDSRNHLIELERLLATGTIRRLNLGVASIYWRHDHNEHLRTYAATCDYTSTDLSTFQDRIVDVGFMDKFWTLEKKMKDYDVAL